MEIKWQVNDGYWGKSRPQTTTIPDEYLDDCETDQEKEDTIDAYIKEDFYDKISWEIID